MSVPETETEQKIRQIMTELRHQENRTYKSAAFYLTLTIFSVLWPQPLACRLMALVWFMISLLSFVSEYPVLSCRFVAFACRCISVVAVVPHVFRLSSAVRVIHVGRVMCAAAYVLMMIFY